MTSQLLLKVLLLIYLNLPSLYSHALPSAHSINFCSTTTHYYSWYCPSSWKPCFWDIFWEIDGVTNLREYCSSFICSIGSRIYRCRSVRRNLWTFCRLSHLRLSANLRCLRRLWQLTIFVYGAGSCSWSFALLWPILSHFCFCSYILS